jgi:hypothetical protein
MYVSYSEVTNGWKDQPWSKMRASTASFIFIQTVLGVGNDSEIERRG